MPNHNTLKMRKLKAVAVAVAAIFCVALAGCIRDAGDTEREPKTGLAVKFASTIAKTRAHDNMWEAGDRIGVYMLPAAKQGAGEEGAEEDGAAEEGAGEEGTEGEGAAEEEGTQQTAEENWNTPGREPLSANMQYGLSLGSGAESSTAIFAGVDDNNIITWPGDGSNVDFVAYYPWRTTPVPDDFIYRIDLSNQNPQKAIDLMYADNVRGVNQGSPALEFRHMLSKLVFNVTDLDGTPLEGTITSISGLPVAAQFNLQTGSILQNSTGPPTPFNAWLAPWETADEGASQEDDGGESEGDEAGEGGDGGESEGEGESGTNPARNRATARIEAIVLPGPANYSVTFTLPNGETAVFQVSDANYKPGNIYSYTINLAADGLAFGNPNGEQSQITGWNQDTDQTGLGSLSETGSGKNGGSGDGENETEQTAGTWNLNPADGHNFYTGGGATINDGICSMPAGGELTIEKIECAAVQTVSVTLRCPNMTSICNVAAIKVGAQTLVYKANPQDQPTTSLNIPISLAFTDTCFTFQTADGQPASGDLEITMSASGSTVVVSQFGINDRP